MQRILLPLETDDFVLLDELPQYNLSSRDYCEFTRLVIAPEYRSEKDVMIRILLNAMSQYSIQNDYSYLFSISPKVQARYYKRVFSSLGFRYKVLDGVYGKADELYSSLKDVVLSIMPFQENHLSTESQPINRNTFIKEFENFHAI